MRFVCLGFYDESAFVAMSESDRQAFMEGCLTYDDELRRLGHFVGGEALRSPSSAATVRFRGGKPLVTDGPYAETKEQLGGILLLEARDLDHAVELMSKHPAIRNGNIFEIRPVNEEVNAMIAARSR